MHKQIHSHKLRRNACALTISQILSCLLQLCLFFPTLFSSHLRGIISLSNPFLTLSDVSFSVWPVALTALAVDSTIVLLRKPPPSHRREMERNERQIPPAPLGRYPYFLFTPLRRQASSLAFVWGVSLNKTSKFCLPFESSYFKQHIG